MCAICAASPAGATKPSARSRPPQPTSPHPRRRCIASNAACFAAATCSFARTIASSRSVTAPRCATVGARATSGRRSAPRSLCSRRKTSRIQPEISLSCGTLVPRMNVTESAGIVLNRTGIDRSYLEQLPPWLTFDQFGRYSMLREALEAARSPLDQDRFSVLDVGGWTRHILGGEGLPILAFLPGDDVLVVDQVESPLLHYQAGDGTSLQFADDSFDFVASADTLEHIPAQQR